MHAVIEARRAAPAILYLPHLQVAQLVYTIFPRFRPDVSTWGKKMLCRGFVGPDRMGLCLHSCGGTLRRPLCAQRYGCCWLTCHQTCLFCYSPLQTPLYPS